MARKKNKLYDVNTVVEALDALGGEALLRTQRNWARTRIINWKRVGRFPHNLSLVICSDLVALGKTFDPSILGSTPEQTASFQPAT